MFWKAMRHELLNGLVSGTSPEKIESHQKVIKEFKTIELVGWAPAS